VVGINGQIHCSCANQILILNFSLDLRSYNKLTFSFSIESWHRIKWVLHLVQKVPKKAKERRWAYAPPNVFYIQAAIDLRSKQDLFKSPLPPHRLPNSPKSVLLNTTFAWRFKLSILLLTFFLELAHRLFAWLPRHCPCNYLRISGSWRINCTSFGTLNRSYLSLRSFRFSVLFKVWFPYLVFAAK